MGLGPAWLPVLLLLLSALPGPSRGAAIPDVLLPSPSPRPGGAGSPVPAEMSLLGGRSWGVLGLGAGWAGRGEPSTLGSSRPSRVSGLGLALLNSDNTLEIEKRSV